MTEEVSAMKQAFSSWLKPECGEKMRELLDFSSSFASAIDMYNRNVAVEPDYAKMGDRFGPIVNLIRAKLREMAEEDIVGAHTRNELGKVLDAFNNYAAGIISKDEFYNKGYWKLAEIIAEEVITCQVGAALIEIDTAKIVGEPSGTRLVQYMGTTIAVRPGETVEQAVKRLESLWHEKGFQHLSEAQEETLTKLYGGHKHWEAVSFDQNTGTATVALKGIFGTTGKQVIISRDGKIISS